MLTLEWIGKNKVVNHHQEVPFRVLERQYSFGEQRQHTENNDSENMIMAENNIPYKVRAALLLVPLNTPMPTGAVTQSLWYIAVRSGDVHRVRHYLRTERDT